MMTIPDSDMIAADRGHNASGIAIVTIALDIIDIMMQTSAACRELVTT